MNADVFNGRSIGWSGSYRFLCMRVDEQINVSPCLIYSKFLILAEFKLRHGLRISFRMLIVMLNYTIDESHLGPENGSYLKQ
jgi:hypothetical protein